MKIPLAFALLTPLFATGASIALAAPEASPAPPMAAPMAPVSNRTSPVAPAPEPGSELAELVKKGATMEEIARLRDPIANNPLDALRQLKAGNARFYGGVARRPEVSANERRAQILSQTPFAIVLGCSDSRVPTEIVYDQGLGSLFIARIAGNIAEPGTLGSVEYGVEHLKSHIVVVMGHEGCGAVKAAMLPSEMRVKEPQNVRYLLDQIVPAVDYLPSIRDEKARMREAVISNVRLQVHRMKQNPVIQKAEKSGKITVVGAFYEIGSGAVDFLETPEELALSPTELRRIQAQLKRVALAPTGEKSAAHEGHAH